MDAKDIINIIKFKLVSGISIDSRTIKKNEIFVAIEGESSDGHDFIDEAIRRGAALIVASKDYHCKAPSVPVVNVSNTRKALAIIAKNFYQDPSSKIKLIGITGTNGKTTVSYLLESIFSAAQRKVGRIGTIDYKIADTTIESVNTTPSSLLLHQLLNQMVRHSLEFAVMEVSSHSLEQRRIDQIVFGTAVFTNISPEHLDYHKSFRRYLGAKKKLFSSLNRDAGAVLNMEDAKFQDIKKAASTKKIFSYGFSGADITIRGLKLNLDKSQFMLDTKYGSIDIDTVLIGRHNILNILAAAGAALMEGIDLASVKKGIESLKEIPGRLQSIKTQGGLRIFVDYAHTDDALKNVLEILGAFKKRNLIALFGCGGQRDRLKRARMGRVASEMADYVIITSDNPRSEDPALIAQEIVSGIRKDFADYEVILDRRKAMEEALSLAGAEDIVLIAGKGHERYQIIGNKKIPFSDEEVVKEILGKNEDK